MTLRYAILVLLLHWAKGNWRLDYQEAKVRRSEAREVLIADAVALFLKEVERLNREEATRAKYRLTLEDRLLNWCAQEKPPVARLSELDVETMRPWIHSWPGAPTTRQNQRISTGELSRSLSFAWNRMDERESGQENQDRCSGAG
jgi:hypothetical protein